MTTPVPLIVDTDPGIDDSVALALAAASPDVDLLAVTTVFGNVGLATTTRNALGVLTLAGRGDVPVAAGAARPLVYPQQQHAARWHAADGVGGKASLLPPPGRTVDPRGAVGLLASVLAAAPAPVTIAPIGPLTNIALLLAVHPGLKPKIGRLVVMGGALAGGNTTARAEFNVFSDPEAARRVLVEEDVPTTLVPLDLTLRCAVGPEWIGALAAGPPPAPTLAAIVDHYSAEYQRHYGEPGVALHDALALAEAIRPGLLRTTALPLDVVCDAGPARGATVTADRPAGRRVDVAVDADLDAVRGFVLNRLVHRS